MPRKKQPTIVQAVWYREGEYSDRREDVEKIFFTVEQAEGYIEALPRIVKNGKNDYWQAGINGQTWYDREYFVVEYTVEGN